MPETIFNDIDRCQTPAELFDLTSDYFQGQGFGGLCYVAPSGPAGPFTMLDRGMPADFMTRYREEGLYRFDPLPALAFRLGHAERLGELVKQLPRLNADEDSFIQELKCSGLCDSLIIPTYGPLGRPGILALAYPVHPRLLDEMNIPLAAAVAQQVHTRMELLQVHDPIPGLSPREREILNWLCQGKSGSDIATILGLAAPTVTTHIQRVYAKLHVHDRITACAKAAAHHYI